MEEDEKNLELKEKSKEGEASFRNANKKIQGSKSSKNEDTYEAKSPEETTCPICLQQIQNKSFTDGCFHQFCFTCILEWSKVKPECPLCKQSFKSIVHNVLSSTEYCRYYRIHQPTETENLSPQRLFERNQSQLASHRMIYAPHTVPPDQLNLRPYFRRHLLPSYFRTRVYHENLWVRHLNPTATRSISPAFFRENHQAAYRLLPWLYRDLLTVMSNNKSEIPFVLELIMALIVKYEITSQEFYSHIEPFTALHTSHFIHEFYNFAISLYDSIETYQQNVDYDSRSAEVSSSDSDVSPPDSDKCEVVDVMPRSGTTQEIIVLTSDDETDIDNSSSFIDYDNLPYLDENGSNISPQVFNLSSENAADDNNNIVFVSERNPKGNATEKPLDSLMEEAKNEVQEIVLSQEGKLCSSSSRNNKDSNPRASPLCLVLRPKKQRDVLLNDSSTKSSSENAQVSERKRQSKKQKVNSDIAHFSFDPSGHRNSTHHSHTHKKDQKQKGEKKDKKKKQKGGQKDKKMKH